MYLTAYKGSFLGPIAKGLGWIMNWIYIFQSNVLHINSVPLAIVLFTIVIYIILFPLTYRQQKFAILQKKMNPEIKAIQDKYKNRKDSASMAAMQEETQSIYDKYGISPMGSCLQLVIQMPILFALYRVFYNIPAYIGSVKGIFTELVNGVITTDGYKSIMEKVVSVNNIKSVTVHFAGDKSVSDKNYVIDVLYKLSDKGWDSLEGSKYFPHLSSSINSVQGQLHKINYLFGINISDTPIHLIQTAFAAGAFFIVFLAILIPVFSYLSQLLNIKVSQAMSDSGDDNMARQMKTMNMMMPLMSLFFAFTLPVGLTFYWIVGALVRTLQTVFLNRKFEQIDLDSIIEKNKVKAAKKKEKRGVRQSQIYESAKINTKKATATSKASYSNKVSDKDLSSNPFENADNHYKKGSLAEKANLVNDFNNKNTKR